MHGVWPFEPWLPVAQPGVRRDLCERRSIKRFCLPGTIYWEGAARRAMWLGDAKHGFPGLISISSP